MEEEAALGCARQRPRSASLRAQAGCRRHPVLPAGERGREGQRRRRDGAGGPAVRGGCSGGAAARGVRPAASRGGRGERGRGSPPPPRGSAGVQRRPLPSCRSPPPSPLRLGVGFGRAGWFGLWGYFYLFSYFLFIYCFYFAEGIVIYRQKNK